VHLGIGPVVLRTAETALLTVILTLPVAYMSYMVAERPFMASRKRARDSGETATVLASRATAVGC
jgi:peptidoglycan/LPS O-acetylase OafA/YrhL